jgi:hypothetical protein
MTDQYAQNYANDHPRATVRAKMPRAVKYKLLSPSNVTVPHATATSLSVAAAGVASCTKGTWNGSPTAYAYQWRRNGVNIAGAVASTYTFVVADEGAMISCNVTATNANGSTSATSNTVGPVTA